MEQLIAGKHAVLEALRSGRALHKIWISRQSKPQSVQAIVAAAKQEGVVVQFVDKRKLDEMAGDLQHQGIVAQVASRSYVELEQILANAEQSGEPPFILLLDEIEDPHNLGSILRTANCTGVHGVVIPKRRAVGLTATVAKVSAGAIEYVPVARVTNMVRTIEQLKEHGIWIAGASGDAQQIAFETDLRGPLALVIGNEHKGIGRLIQEKCDYLISLPMKGQIESLNASVAAGVLMYEVLRQRQTN